MTMRLCAPRVRAAGTTAIGGKWLIPRRNAVRPLHNAPRRVLGHRDLEAAEGGGGEVRARHGREADRQRRAVALRVWVARNTRCSHAAPET